LDESGKIGGYPEGSAVANNSPEKAASMIEAQVQPGVLYRRVLLKLSGEALMGELEYGIEPRVIQRIAAEIAEVRKLGVELAIVIGGGNLFRGAGLARAGMDRVTGDNMGMLATVMNALAIQDALESLDMDARVMSALEVHKVCEDYIRRRAVRHLEKGRVVILAAGTGNPFFTTDTAASLRAIEIGADVLTVSFDKVLADKLKVIDATAVVMCRDNNLPLRIFNLNDADALVQAMTDEDVGTLVTA
jgi:uridylate kinase